VGCVTGRRVDVSSGGYRVSARPHALTLAKGDAVPIRGGANGLVMRIAQQYVIVQASDESGPWKVKTTSYAYSLRRRGTNGQEVLAFHWHPDGPSRVTTPHLHISAGSGVVFPRLLGAHIPTRRISVEQFLRLILDELGVKARRDDWRKVLDKGQRDFEDWQTWA
jgi:hypothetical protein